jgi:hypothetical protein
MARKIPFAYGPELPRNLPTVGFGSYFHTFFERTTHESLRRHKRFAAFVPLLSTYYLIQELNSPLSGAPQHIFKLIPEHLIRAAADNRCVLVFDAGFEGDPFLQGAYDNLHRWLDANHISRSNVLMINQNRVLEELYKENVGAGIQFANYDAYVKKTLAIFAGDPISFKADVGFDHKEVCFRPPNADTKTFLCLNGAPRPNRVLVVAALAKAGLLKDTEWSMLGDIAKKVKANLDEARTFRSKFNVDWILDGDIAQILAEIPKVIAIEEGKLDSIYSSNELALKINIELFKVAFCSVVTETEFTAGDAQRLTEKFIKPLAMGHPTVLFGNPHSLQQVKQFGFETFGDIVDESYDECLDVAERIRLVTHTLEQMQAIRRSNSTASLAKIREICTHNIDVASNGVALKNYESNVEHSLTHKLLEMVGQLSHQ